MIVLIRFLGGEIGRARGAGDISIPRTIYVEAITFLITTPTKVGGVIERVASATQLGNEDVSASSIIRLKRILGGEVKRVSVARDIGIPRTIYGNTITIIIITSAQIGGVAQCVSTA